MNNLKKEERCIYYDTDLQIEAYEFKGIAQKFNSHFHNEYVIGLIEHGKRQFYCKNNEYTLNTGDILLINPSEIHGCEQFGEENLHYFSLNISTSTMQKIMQEITGKSAILPHFSESVIHKKDVQVLFSDLKQMILQEHQDFQKEATFILLMEYLISNFAKITLHQENLKQNDKAERMEHICQYLEENFYRNIHLDELSLLVGLNKYYLLRCFTEIKGISPHKYLETIRIKKAKQLLSKGIPLIDIALKVGFSDQSHFTNLFKALIGLTPKTYQKIMQYKSEERS